MKSFIFCLALISTVAMASEENLYNFEWLDADKEIYVLQNRKFRKKGSFYLGAVGNKTVSGPFVDSFGGALKAGFFFKEDWGFEVSFGSNSPKENDTFDGVGQSGTVAYYRSIKSYFGGYLMWSPFYNKINTFNQIFYYDLMFGLGFAQINTQDNREDVQTIADPVLTEESATAASWLIAWRLFLSESWSLRFDITAYHYQAERFVDTGGGFDSKDDWFHQYDMGVGVNYSF